MAEEAVSAIDTCNAQFFPLNLYYYFEVYHGYYELGIATIWEQSSRILHRYSTVEIFPTL